MILSPELSSERGMLISMALVLTPWLAVVLFTGGAWTALVFCGYVIVVCAVGYGALRATLPQSCPSSIILLTPSIGILVVSALTAFALRIGLPLGLIPALWLVLMAVGGIYLWRDRKGIGNGGCAYGRALVILSVAICAIYFLPAARNDAVLRHDDSFNWMYVDTQYFQSMAEAIENSEGPPRDPGTVTEELRYHFAPYAPAAVVSRVTYVALGDALVRVTRAASLWAVLLASFGLGTILSLKATGEKFGGIMSVAGLFFYGSLSSLFAEETNSSSQIARAVIHKIPGVEVLASGGPFSHLILGHSVLHGLSGIIVVTGLCIVHRDSHESSILGKIAIIMMPVLVVPVNSVAALYCLGVAGILLFWGRLRAVSSWGSIALMTVGFMVAWKLMGFGHNSDAATVSINQDPVALWWMLVVWFVIGLGFRLVALEWISQVLSEPIAALVLASLVGLLAFSILLKFEYGEQRYGIYFLQSMLSLFAFSRLRPGFWRMDQREPWAKAWLRLAAITLLCFVSMVVGLRAIIVLLHRELWIASYRRQILPCLLLLLACAATLKWMKRSPRFARAASCLVLAFLSIGFLAWIAPWLNFGLGRMKMDITLTSGEVRGLEQLSNLAAPNQLFATNRHRLKQLVNLPERSYGYAALSQRPVLLEGYAYRGESTEPGFQKLLHDNDLMFATTDAEMLRELAGKWHVKWLVAQPGTDIAVTKPLPEWLVKEPDTGDLNIYRIN